MFSLMKWDFLYDFSIGLSSSEFVSFIESLSMLSELTPEGAVIFKNISFLISSCNPAEIFSYSFKFGQIQIYSSALSSSWSSIFSISSTSIWEWENNKLDADSLVGLQLVWWLSKIVLIVTHQFVWSYFIRQF